MQGILLRRNIGRAIFGSPCRDEFADRAVIAATWIDARRHIQASTHPDSTATERKSDMPEANVTSKPKTKPVPYTDSPKFDSPSFEIPKFEIPNFEVPAAFRE